MRAVTTAWIFAFFAMAFFSPVVLVAEPGPKSCECPKLDCGPCMEEQGLTFYSEKCGDNNSQVRSCTRPTCVVLQDPPASCANKPRQPASVLPGSAIPQVSSQTPIRGPVIGIVKVVDGVAWLKLPDGSRRPVEAGTEIHERDSLQTEKSGKVNVEFKDGNLVQIQNDSMVRISEYEMNEGKRKAVIDLLKGQLRNQVKQKYNGTTSSYQVKTKTAVAGVRGTDFVVEYREGEKIETEIKTIEGQVVFANKDFSQSLEIRAGQQARYVVAANEIFGKEEMNEFVARGYMTPLHKMSAKEIEFLMRATTLVATNRKTATAAKSAQICSSPSADLNQCSFTCVNNPKGEKICRTELENVSCVRKRCNANGEWSEESRLPAAFREQCGPKGVKIAPCDY